MKEYTAIITDGKKEWEEHHNIPDKLDPTETVKTTLRMFNRSRGTTYSFVKFKRQRTANTKQVHDWGKSSLVTEKGGYDKMKCKNCGATGRRYGTGTNGVVPDAKFDHTYCKN